MGLSRAFILFSLNSDVMSVAVVACRYHGQLDSGVIPVAVRSVESWVIFFTVNVVALVLCLFTSSALLRVPFPLLYPLLSMAWPLHVS